MGEALPTSAEEGQHQHGEEDNREAQSGAGNGTGALGHDGERAVNEFDVDPIDKKRGVAQLDERAEALLCEAPAAPGVNKRENDEEHATAHEKEIGVRVPIVVNGIKPDGRRIKEHGENAGKHAGEAKESEEKRLAAAGKVRKNEEAYGEPGKGEGGPGKNRKEPVLRLVERVHAIDVGLEGPREKARAPGGPERRRGQRNERGGKERGEDAAAARERRRGGGGKPAEHAHQHYGKAEDIEHVNAQEIGPRGRPTGEEKFLDAEEDAVAKNVGAAKDGLAGNGVAGDSLLAESAGDEGNGNARKKNKKRRGKSAAKLRQSEERGVALIGAEPGVVAVGLKHEEAGEAAHPVDVGEARRMLAASGRFVVMVWSQELSVFRYQLSDISSVRLSILGSLRNYWHICI